MDTLAAVSPQKRVAKCAAAGRLGGDGSPAESWLPQPYRREQTAQFFRKCQSCLVEFNLEQLDFVTKRRHLERIHLAVVADADDVGPTAAGIF